MGLESKQIQQLYIAYFARPADPSGVNYWLNNSRESISLRQIAKLFSFQSEYRNLISVKTSTDFQINQFYLNLFGRKADFEGVKYWLVSLEKGTLDINDIVCDLIWSARNPSIHNFQESMKDLKTLENKVYAAELFTEEIRSNSDFVNLYKPESLDPWIAGKALQAGVNFLNQVNSNTKASKNDVIDVLQSITKEAFNVYKEPILKLENVSLKIPVHGTENRKFTKILIGNTINSIIGGKLNNRDNQTNILVLKNINLTILNGERVALIGHNGSGKSTFLKLISGIYSLSSGKMKISVDVYPMLQKSFLTSNELSGIDAAKAHYLLVNRNLNGFNEYLKEIVDFSGLGDYISLPIKTYSDGMSARLIFSLLTSCEHDCLAIDEGFGTGDSEFFERAEKRLKSFIDAAGTLFLASHSEELLRQFCTRGIVFNHGSIVYDGLLDEALNYYHASDYYENV